MRKVYSKGKRTIIIMITAAEQTGEGAEKYKDEDEGSIKWMEGRR